MASVVKTLSGTINGSNRVFDTPTTYVAGSIIPIINGVVYAAADDDWGCAEVDSNTIRLNTAPAVGYLVQAFYVESEATGSPFDPTGMFP
jgi:hypothetical protein